MRRKALVIILIASLMALIMGPLLTNLAVPTMTQAQEDQGVVVDLDKEFKIQERFNECTDKACCEKVYKELEKKVKDRLEERWYEIDVLTFECYKTCAPLRPQCGGGKTICCAPEGGPCCYEKCEYCPNRGACLDCLKACDEKDRELRDEKSILMLGKKFPLAWVWVPGGPGFGELRKAKDECIKRPPEDSDGDGVPDDKDKCPNTPKGVEVDESGCPENQDPIAKFDIMPQNPTPDDHVVCFELSEDPDGDPLTYIWILDGNEAGTGPTCQLGQLEAGEHTIKLKVDDERGGVDECEETITVVFITMSLQAEDDYFSGENHYLTKIKVQLTGMDTIPEEIYTKLLTEYNTQALAGVKLKAGLDLVVDLMIDGIKINKEGIPLTVTEPNLYRFDFQSIPPFEWALMDILSNLKPIKDWAKSHNWTCIEYLALKRIHPLASDWSDILEEPLVRLTDFRTLEIKVVSASVFLEDMPGHHYYETPVAITKQALEFKIGDDVVVDEVAWAKHPEAEITLTDVRDFALIFCPSPVGIAIHGLKDGKWLDATVDCLDPATQLLVYSLQRIDRLLYAFTDRYESARMAGKFLEEYGYEHISPGTAKQYQFWFNYANLNMAIIDRHGMIHELKVADEVTVIVPYFSFVSADEPFWRNYTYRVDPGDTKYGPPRREPPKRIKPLYYRDEGCWVFEMTVVETTPRLETEAEPDGWLYIETRRGGQLVLQRASRMRFDFIKRGKIYAIPRAIIEKGEVTVRREPMTIGVGHWTEKGRPSEWIEGKVSICPPEIIAKIEPRGTRYTIKVEENQSFKVTVEEGSVEVMDCKGVVDTVTDGSEREFDFEELNVNQLPIASFSIMPENPTPEDIILGLSTSSDPDGNTLTYEWYFDGEYNGKIGNSDSWQWYLEPGKHTIKLVVEDGWGGIDEFQMTIMVSGGGLGVGAIIGIIVGVIVVFIIFSRVRARSKQGD